MNESLNSIFIQTVNVFHNLFSEDQIEFQNPQYLLLYNSMLKKKQSKVKKSWKIRVIPFKKVIKLKKKHELVK